MKNSVFGLCIVCAPVCRNMPASTVFVHRKCVDFVNVNAKANASVYVMIE